jgi:NADPH:quinone reductase-like Zn-dependent oxidoreductase
VSEAAKQWAIPAFGIDKLALNGTEIPEPRPGEIVMKVHACSLNYRDLMTVTGVYNPKLPLPRVPLSDGAGIVHSVGAGVSAY